MFHFTTHKSRAISTTLFLAILLVIGIVHATGLGYIQISAKDVLDLLLYPFTHAGGHIDPLYQSILYEVRLPRIMTSVVVGFGLAIAGTVFQGLLLNPLADPFTLGIASGAAFGAAISLYLGLHFFGPTTLCFMAFGGATLTLLAVLALSGRDGEWHPTHLILSGIIISSILSAGLSFVKYMADERVSAIIFWLMGSFVARTWNDAALTGIITLSGFVICLYYARDLNLMSLGARSAKTLGVNTGFIRLILLITASLISAACVSVAGVIGFVGLIIPHLLRICIGPDNRWLLPAAGLGGGLLMLGADTVTRAILPNEVPVGVLTALIGGPIFCWIFTRSYSGKRYE